GCASTLKQQPPVAEVLEQHATAGPLPFVEASVITDNDAAFAAKLRLVEEAKESLDLAYYIFSDDYTSSRLSQALIDAARRGVRVRLLLDYFSAYKDLDHFSWLEQQGGGKIEVRLYNRPTLEIIKDAAFLTLSCADVGAQGSACDDEKVRVVSRQFEADAVDGQGISNRSFAGSGLFLSGLYGKHAQLMAYAVTSGQAIDTAALTAGAPTADSKQTEQLKKLGKLYFQARYMGGVEGLSAKFKLAFVRLAFAEQVNPVFDAVSSHLPLSRQNDAQAQKDWDYLTEFLHHKFLLADRNVLMLGGRNVEDSYHMRPNPLADKYIFMDTDVRLQLRQPDATLAASFDRLWNLRSMVAALDEVRGHAPNDLLMNFDALQAAQDACNQGKDQTCVDRQLDRHFRPLAARMQTVADRHRQHLRRYAAEYRAAQAPAPLRIDDDASVFYLENLPVADGRRSYGARHNREAATSKHIQALWRSAMQGVCASTTPAARDVFIHNAYLFMPANLLQDVAAMLDGSRPCPGVTLSLVTNSLATTDLNVVNLLAVWQLKALADHLQDAGANANSATLRYFEYQPVANTRLSLHSKVMVFDQDIFIGSANADVRSLMMDSNNGFFIRNAPGFVQEYKQGLQKILDSPGQISDQTRLIGRDAAQLSVEMNQLIDQLLARYAGPDRLTDEQQQGLKQRIQGAAQRVYELSREIMRGNTKAADEFNSLFKAI
ncbi:MAG: phospholipase D-like domain-containing protein, partial [Azoarcus sp.]|nr:phospholipase D-like domain-containing protein [Azoarcus sp.]